MNYIKLNCTITSGQMEISRELLAHLLGELGFESFEDSEEGLIGYIREPGYTDNLRNALPSSVLDLGTITYSAATVKDRNWNEEWEKNFPPITIANKCYIRAPFHGRNPAVPYEIIIEPKMAFGTGHHETTSLMIEQMLSLNFKDQEVLDMGCGTGVLAIMASMLQAKHILAIDIDEWAYRSTNENCKVNHIGNVTAQLGGIELVRGKSFGIVLANINRNILLEQIPVYSASLPKDGILVLSGIYNSDFTTLHDSANQNGFRHLNTIEKNKWIAVVLTKN